MPKPPPTPRSQADIDRLAHAYLDAEYRWARDGDWHDIRVGLPVPALELVYPGVDCFGLLSAWDPYSIPRDDAINRSEDEALAAALTGHGLQHLPAFSSAANRSWREPGWVVPGIDVARLDELAARFGQLGTLWWPRGGAVRLRMLAARPLQFQREAAIDWLE